MVCASLLLAWPFSSSGSVALKAPGEGHKLTGTQSSKHLHMQVTLPICMSRTGFLTVC